MDIILAQVKNVMSNYATKNIDTGDKIFDVAIGVVLLALFDMIVKFVTGLYTSFNSKQILGKNPWDFDPLLVKKISEDDVKKYKYSLLTGYPTRLKIIGDEMHFSDNIYYWIDTIFSEKCSRQFTTKCHFLDNIQRCEAFEVNNTNIKSLVININQQDKSQIFMPIWAYCNNNQLEYIYVYNYALWSNSMDELKKCINHISKFTVEKFELFTEKNVKQKNAKQKDLEIVELTELWKDDKKEYSKSYKQVGFVNKNKTFDKIYFDEKDKLLEMIEKYQSKTIYPSSLGLDNKLGILLYGPPGTGKTGTIFCVANLLQKPILLINSLKVKKSTIIAAVNDVKKTHIIVLDEFDHLLNELRVSSTPAYGGFFSEAYSYHHTQIQNVHAQIKAKTKKNNDHVENIECEEQTTKTVSAEDSYKDLPNDVFMYKLLDSFGDDDGRLIIATTNNPNMVSPVLLRPGRFDMKLCLGYCSLEMFVNITQKIFDINEYIKNQQNLDNIMKILKLNITPLVLINTLVLSNTLDECLCKLSKEKQKNYYKKPNEDTDD